MTKTITVDKTAFLSAAQIGGTFAAKQKTMPILECVRCKVHGGEMRITSYDGENAASAKCAVTCNEDVAFCVEHKEMIAYAMLMPQEFDFIIDDERNTVTMKHPAGKKSFPMFDAKDFPEITVDKDAVQFSVPAGLLHEWLVRGTPFCSQDGLRPILSNMYFEIANGEYVFCCTDSYSLLFGSSPVAEGTDIQTDVLIPRNAALALSKLMRGRDKSANIVCKSSQKNITFILGDGVSVMARRGEGKFPNFRSVATAGEHSLAVDKGSLQLALSRVMSDNFVKLEFGSDGIRITSVDLQGGKEATELVPCDVETEMTIGFKCEVFARCVGAMPDNEDFTIEYTTPNRPILMRGSDGLTAVCMPSKVN